MVLNSAGKGSFESVIDTYSPVSGNLDYSPAQRDPQVSVVPALPRYSDLRAVDEEPARETALETSLASENVSLAVRQSHGIGALLRSEVGPQICRADRPFASTTRDRRAPVWPSIVPLGRAPRISHECVHGQEAWHSTMDKETPALWHYRRSGYRSLGHGSDAPKGKPGLSSFTRPTRLRKGSASERWIADLANNADGLHGRVVRSPNRAKRWSRLVAPYNPGGLATIICSQATSTAILLRVPWSRRRRPLPRRRSSTEPHGPAAPTSHLWQRWLVAT